MSDSANAVDVVDVTAETVIAGAAFAVGLGSARTMQRYNSRGDAREQPSVRHWSSRARARVAHLYSLLQCMCWEEVAKRRERMKGKLRWYSCLSAFRPEKEKSNVAVREAGNEPPLLSQLCETERGMLGWREGSERVVGLKWARKMSTEMK